MDILEDLRQRLLDIGFTDPKIERVVMEVRNDWRGERPYIGAQYESDRRMSARNMQIIRDYKAGERIAFLARKYGISRQRVWKIING